MLGVDSDRLLHGRSILFCRFLPIYLMKLEVYLPVDEQIIGSGTDRFEGGRRTGLHPNSQVVSLQFLTRKI